MRDNQPKFVTQAELRDAAPCACFADGVAIATYASVGQRTLTIVPEKAPPGMAASSSSAHVRAGLASNTQSQCQRWPSAGATMR